MSNFKKDWKNGYLNYNVYFTIAVMKYHCHNCRQFVCHGPTDDVEWQYLPLWHHHYLTWTTGGQGYSSGSITMSSSDTNQSSAIGSGFLADFLFKGNVKEIVVLDSGADLTSPPRIVIGNSDVLDSVVLVCRQLLFSNSMPSFYWALVHISLSTHGAHRAATGNWRTASSSKRNHATRSWQELQSHHWQTLSYFSPRSYRTRIRLYVSAQDFVSRPLTGRLRAHNALCSQSHSHSHLEYIESALCRGMAMVCLYTCLC